MRTLSSLPAIPVLVGFFAIAALGAYLFSVIHPQPAPLPYQPGPRQLEVLSATKDYGYDGAVFRDASTLVIYTTPRAHRSQVRQACGLGRAAGMRWLTVVAMDREQRTVQLESFTCDLQTPRQ